MQQYLSGESLVFSAKNDAEASFELTLPEYLPGISRIAKTSVCAENVTFRSQDSNAFLDLLLRITVIYISDFAGKIKSASFHENLSLELRGNYESCDDATVIPSSFFSSVLSKQLSPRKIHTSFTCHGSVNILKENQTPILSDSENDGICVLKKEIGTCRKTTLPETVFEQEAEISVDASKPNVGEIVYSDAVFCSCSCTVSEERLDFEGKFMLHTMYEVASDNNDETSEYAVLTSPITVRESIHDDRITPSCRPYIYLEPISAEPSVSFDPYGENRIISFTLKYNASPVIYTEDTAEIITDAFSENYESNLSTADISANSLRSTIFDSVHLSQTLKADIKDLSHISDCLAKILSVSFEYTDGRFFALAKCLVETYGANSQGEFSCVDALTNLHIPISASEPLAQDCLPDVIISVKDCHAEIREGSIVCEFDTEVCGVILCTNTFRAVTEFETDIEKPKSSRKGEIVISYPPKGSTLWGISKKYSVNPSALKKANSLENDDISSKHILLIP